MFIMAGDDFCDSDLGFLHDLFTLLDSQLDDLKKRIAECADPDGMGLCDVGEFLAGTGFVACQRYLASTYGPHGVAKDAALALGPHHTGGETFANILNAAANYWKHVDEWGSFVTFGEGGAVKITRDVNVLKEPQKKTIRIIESVTPWSDYTCANLLFELTCPDWRLAGLIPKLEDWRQQLASAHVG